MKSICLMFIGILCSLSSLARADSIGRSSTEFQISESERHQEAQYLVGRGFKLNGDLVLEQPFRAPFSSRSLVVPTSWYWTKPSDAKASDLLADLDVLQMVFKTAYGGYEIAEQRGWNWEKFFSDWKVDLVTQGQARLPIAQLTLPFKKFKIFQTDNHSNLVDPSAAGTIGLMAGSRTAVLSSRSASTCSALINKDGELFSLVENDPGQQPRTALLRNDAGRFLDTSYIAYPNSFGEGREIVCGGEHIKLTEAWHYKPEEIGAWLMKPESEKGKVVRELADPQSNLDPLIAYKYPTYRSVTSQIGYIRIPSLNAHLDLEKMRQKLILPSDVSQKRLIILDLRANGGGFFTGAVKMFVEKMTAIPSLAAALGNLIGDDTHTAFPLTRKNSCLDSALNWGSVQNDSKQNSPSPSAEVIAESQPILDAIMSGPSDCKVTFSQGKFDWLFGQHKFKPDHKNPIFLVLVDELCGSDCEGVLFVLARSPNTLIAGVNTYGVLQFVQPRNFLLPATRIPVEMATGYSNVYGDNRSVESRGLHVDILLPTKAAQSAQAVIDLAQKILLDDSLR